MNSSHGIVVLPAAIQLSYGLAKLAMMLDKRPDLTRRLRKVVNVDEGESRKTLVEGTAESIQRAFTVCLTERSTNPNGIGKDGKPEGKKVGIYSFANLALKLYFQVGKETLHARIAEVNRSNSVGNHDWRTNSSRTYPKNPLL